MTESSVTYSSELVGYGSVGLVGVFAQLLRSLFTLPAPPTA